MCGIAGKFSYSRDNRTRETIINSMVDALTNRGPDGKGIVSAGGITLGHTRLAILDLTQRAAQPMVDETSRFYIVYNGEVYNFMELREELVNAGFVFFSNSDTEVVLKAYIHWGAECFRKFNGMFALAIWDNVNSELTLARDRFGKKPLYYYISPDLSISFASTLSALRNDPDVPEAVSMEALNCFLALGYILAPLSFIEGVKKLEPSHFLRLDLKNRRIIKQKYWDYACYFSNKTRDNEKDITSNIFSLMKQAVKRRMISDVPLGAFLSGGLDSSSVVKIMTEYNPDVMAFSIGFDEPDYDELPYSRKIAESISLKNHSCRTLDTKTVPDEMFSMFNAFDEPFADTSLVPMMSLARFARSKVTVGLSGDGADEIFGGYVTYIADSLAFKYRRVPLFMRNYLASVVQALPVSLNQKVGLDYKVRQFIEGSQYDEEKSHYSWRLMFTPEERVLILGRENRDIIYDTDPFILFRNYYSEVRGLHYLDRNLYVDAKTWLPDDILVKLDRATMFVGLESRCPFLDNDLAEYAAGVPVTLKIRHFKLKYLLKKTMTGYLPALAVRRKKSGFNAPVSRWIRQLEHKGIVTAGNTITRKNEYCYFVGYVYKGFSSAVGIKHG